MPARADRLLRRADAVLAFPPKIFLDEPVFQRMKRDDCQPSARLESLHCHGKDFFNRLQFVVDNNAQSLESLRGRVVRTVPVLDPLDDTGQLPGAVYRPGCKDGHSDDARLR